MKNIMNYKGYVGSVQFNEEEKILHGQIKSIRSLVNYEASNIEDLEAAFREAVDDYLELCEQEGKEPDQPFQRHSK
ncbi:type II toxin-antitoxin system HicB family antitoxin [Kiloniella spongiae]|uniref:type II toxin-antitoxin system HicB family antitoxin n=1 Tax=Kiloniella spongiae TaxID=1489064 RepID=UPI0012E0AF04|nr:hypothetical protein [Kiloniella spongiae]